MVTRICTESQYPNIEASALKQHGRRVVVLLPSPLTFTPTGADQGLVGNS
jgi:hypothetical protein